MSDYQVAIIGGRPAGASLAIRLGRLGIRTLVVDKMTFPSLPSVPSSPIIYSHHLDMLAELGLTEDELFHPGGRFDSFVATFVGHFHRALSLNIPEAKHGYAYGADRTRFDTAIWEHAARLDSVTARSGFSVTGILKENGRVVGIKGQTERGKEETITADLVVGADGRFSFAAQQFGAATLEEHNRHITTTFHADWENVEDGPVPRSGGMYTAVKGFLVLMIPIDTRKYIVATYMRPERHQKGIGAEESYLEGLQRFPPVWARLKDATRTTPVVGIKGIRNGIRQPSGDGWALVGDAFHYKDPLDGQGIYDALLETKFLAEAIQTWLAGEKTWPEAGQDYGNRSIEATRAMMLHTVRRVKQEVFTTAPPLIVKTIVRWVSSSPEVQHDMIRLLIRASEPANWQTPGAMRRAIWDGLKNDLFRRGSGQLTPS